MKKEKITKNKSRLKLGIKFKLISMFIILITIPVLISGTASYLKANSILKENLKGSTLETIKQTKQAIDNYTTSFEQSAIQLAHDPNVQQVNGNPDSLTWMMGSFKSFMESHKDVQAVYIGTGEKNTYIS